MSDKIRTAVITGGHSYDVKGFHILFRTLKGVDAYIQHMDDFASSPEEVRDGYDCIVFYTMLIDSPSDEGLPWYAGSPKAAMERLGETPQGIVILHHSLVAYPDWDLWSELVGKRERKNFGYQFDQSIRVEVLESNHPITRGLQGWTMVDETYHLGDADAADALKGNEILLTVDHPESMRTVAWIRQYRKSRVFCCQLGHDVLAWSNLSFQEILTRGIAWSVSGQK